MIFQKLIAFVIIASLATATDAATTRGLFVGIDDYQFSKDNGGDNEFRNLRGAVNDTINIKNALRPLYRIALDKTAPDACPSETAGDIVSITLFNKCATRAKILKSLDQLITMSKPGDTLLFYFAGHGAQYSAIVRADQSSGYSGTILPFDARDPDSNEVKEIFDYELKDYKLRAVARGVYFISIFDSCNSGTATRSGAIGGSRSAPPLALRSGQSLPNSDIISDQGGGGANGGYWVHMAAAQDGQIAKELPSGGIDGVRNGVFTTALIDTLKAMPKASFSDIMRHVQAQVGIVNVNQTPSVEGDGIQSSLGSKSASVALFKASVAGSTLMLPDDGRTSGITEGSVFSLFADETTAREADATPVATAFVSQVGSDQTKLTLKQPDMAAKLTNMPALTARETTHAFTRDILKIGNRIPPGPDHDAVNKFLDSFEFIKQADAGELNIAKIEESADQLVLVRTDGTVIANLGSPQDSGFQKNLETKLKKAARVNEMLGLLTPVNEAGIDFCIDDSKYGVLTCPKPERRNMRLIKVDEKAQVTITNRNQKPRYFYVFGIDPNFGIAVIMPPPGAKDSALPEGRAYRNASDSNDDPVIMRTPGTYRFLTIASEKPINPLALEQTGIAARGSNICQSALEKLLCNANEGKRGDPVPRVGEWSATMETVLVE
ncbi:caspase family protein [Parasphingorhabdus halotolerans]|uniref:Peptidase C14 caspase domain-containing protein n=1 Tax=Parasphingorhabdus halotolerans TaxID=2725558 RepID=A0A6H2DIL8_9SPHN|nr:caspase family protein [Parasphingorhabdus halotolerans]QJB68519.1 hypothetical protein HF685_03790 [Parasphingorhabdus halotolerans]